jgi:hypothetical protein
MLSSVLVRIDRVCGLEARLLLYVLLLCTTSDQRLLCGDGGGSSSAASVGLLLWPPQMATSGSTVTQAMSGEEEGLDRDFAIWGRREE